ncbi:MAG: pyruvate dehydrogenase (acetyl-transferring) E1 component subunit alpha [Actinobacteria bacterium]|nr:MAG: pyruvate dehydrogenase (acetyl-transferring) E1 component subunit alpha [Actinomycetota bacterium]
MSLSTIPWGDIAAHYADDFPIHSVLSPNGEIVDKQAMKQVSDKLLVELMEDMVWAHVFDQRIITLNKQGSLGNYAPAGGQEASQFAALKALTKSDLLVPTYRDLAPLIKHGVPMHRAFLWWRGHIAGNIYPDDVKVWVPQVIVGATYLHAAGAAMAMARKGEKRVVMAYLGDGATSQGDFYEGLNFAGVFKAPVIGIIQNNQYAISVPIAHQTAAQTLAQKGAAAGVPALRVDGNDPVAMYLAVKSAREYAIGGGGPILIEAVTYRTGSHTMSDEPSRYRQDSEVEEWVDKSALNRLRKLLTEKKLWTVEREEEIAEQVKAEIKDALTEMGKEPAQKVTDFLTVMYEEPPANIKEQIALYSAKEGN